MTTQPEPSPMRGSHVQQPHTSSRAESGEAAHRKEEKLWQALRDNPGSTATALSTAAGIADGGSRPADRWSITTDDQPTDDQPTDDQPGKSQRLAPGALRGMVEDYLREKSGEFSLNAIGKALNRSSGVVHNALEKLVESGYAVRTSDKPKKYSLAAPTATTTE